MLALAPQLERLRAEAASMPTTVGVALSRLGEQIGRVVDQFNRASGATAAISSSISARARNIEAAFGDVLVVAAGATAVAFVRSGLAARKYLAELLAKIAAERSAVATAVAHARARVSYAQAEVAAAQAAVAAAAGLARLTAVQNTLVPAQQRLAAAQPALNAAMASSSVVASRVAAALGALATLRAMGATAWSLWGNRAESAARR